MLIEGTGSCVPFVVAVPAVVSWVGVAEIVAVALPPVVVVVVEGPFRATTATATAERVATTAMAATATSRLRDERVAERVVHPGIVRFRPPPGSLMLGELPATVGAG